MILYRQIREALLAVDQRPDTLAGGVLSPAVGKNLREATHFADLLKEISEVAERARHEAIPKLSFTEFHTFSLTGTRIEYEIPYFERRGRLLALTIMIMLDESDTYVEALENLVWEICNEYAWALPAHLPDTMERVLASRIPPNRVVDLFAAETAHGLAEMLYLVGDRLSSWVVSRVKDEIEQRVFQPVFESSYHFLWTAVTNNWSAVCGGAVGMAALLLVEDRERLAGMQDRVVSAMDSFLAGYGDDGCCPEGVGYWNYGFGYFVYWAEMLYECTGGAINLLEQDKIKRIAEFPGNVMLNDTLCINYSDCNATYRPNTGLISRLCSRLAIAPPDMTRVPSFHADHCYRWPHQIRNLLWTEPERLQRSTESKSQYYTSTDWVVDKRETPVGLLAFSAKGGHNHEAHNHNDLGHFILHVAGESLLADLGGGVYTRDYFGVTRYSHLHTSSAGHSVPVINGNEQLDGEAYRAVVTKYDKDSDRLKFELDLTSAYPLDSGIRAFHRAYEWMCCQEEAAAQLLITDRFVFEEKENEVERSVTEHFISYHKPDIRGSEVTWRGEKGTVSLHFDPTVLTAEVEALETRMHDASSVTVFRLHLHADHLPQSYECRLHLACQIA